MGGNAIKQAKRQPASIYHTIASNVVTDLQMALSRLLVYGHHLNVKAQVIPAYHNKQDFGDIDCVYCVNSSVPTNQLLTDSVLTELSKLGGSSELEFVRNKDVVSLLYHEMQLDLIRVEPEEFDFALGYFSYNDLGNLIGKIAHNFGLKFGHHGLTMPIRENDNHVVGEVILTLNFADALEFLGFDYSRYQRGFNDLVDIFQFVVDSKHFNAQLFSFENMNATARIRDRKRSTYNQFLQFIEQTKPANKWEFDADKTTWMPVIFERFPNTEHIYEQHLKEVVFRREVRRKITEAGLFELIQMMPNNVVGPLMAKFHAMFPRSLILTCPESQLKSKILSFISNQVSQ